MARTISVAMIVRDESEHLAECLASIAGLADEICIVDTGSRDNTVEIARQLKAKMSFFIWCDDFAAARNESLRLCTGDWVFILDADERLDKEDFAGIRMLLDGPRNAAYRFTTRNYTNTTSVSDFHRDPDDTHAGGFAGWYPSTKVRLFPNHANARFIGKVHELVNHSLEAQGVQILTSNIPVYHYPFRRTPARILEKQKQYLELGRAKIDACPDDPKAYAELGNQLAETGDYASAAAAFRESLKRDPSNAEVMKDLGGVLHMLRRDEDAKTALRLALKLNPSLAEAWRNLGVVHADQKEWTVAIECFEMGVSLDPKWMDGHRYLSIALEGANRLAEAAVESRRTLEADPASSQALQLFIHQMLRLEKRPEAREILEGIIKQGKQTAEIENALGELFYYDELFEESKGHFQMAGEMGIAAAFNNLGVVLYRQHMFEAAKAAFENCLEGDPGHRGALANLQKCMARLGSE